MTEYYSMSRLGSYNIIRRGISAYTTVVLAVGLNPSNAYHYVLRRINAIQPKG